MAVTKVRGDYAILSRGKHCAKHMDSGKWASRDEKGDLILDVPGRWMLHTSDGYSRKVTIYVTLNDACELTEAFGSRSKFSEI